MTRLCWNTRRGSHFAGHTLHPLQCIVAWAARSAFAFMRGVYLGTHQTIEDFEARGRQSLRAYSTHHGSLNVDCDTDLCFKEAQDPALDRRNMMRSDMDPHVSRGNVVGHILTIPHLVVRHRKMYLVTRRKLNSANNSLHRPSLIQAIFNSIFLTIRIKAACKLTNHNTCLQKAAYIHLKARPENFIIGCPP